MQSELAQLSGLDELDGLLSLSDDQPVLLFKHSYSCGISAEALDELRQHVTGSPGKARYAMVTVQTHRDISNAVSKRLGIRHETPQALLIRRGKVVWSASHFRVTADAVASAVNAQSQ